MKSPSQLANIAADHLDRMRAQIAGDESQEDVHIVIAFIAPTSHQGRVVQHEAFCCTKDLMRNALLLDRVSGSMHDAMHRKTKEN